MLKLTITYTLYYYTLHYVFIHVLINSILWYPASSHFKGGHNSDPPRHPSRRPH